MAKYRSHAEITTNGWAIVGHETHRHPNYTTAVRLMNVQKVDQLGTEYSVGYTVSKSSET